MIIRNALLAATLVVVSSACTTAGAAGGITASGADAEREHVVRATRDELVNTGGWVLQSAKTSEGSDITGMDTADAPFEMAFSSGQVSAVGGCNHLRGEYTMKGKRLEMSLPIATKMSCTDDKNLADRSFSNTMSGAFMIELLQPQPYRMRLTTDEGVVMIFQAKPMPL